MACELVRNGRIGRLQAIRVWLPEDQGTGNAQPTPVPKNLDYDFWLGPTPQAPYCEDRVHPQMSYERPGWLQVEPYCRGMVTGWGSHMMDIAQWGNGTDQSGPVSIEATAEFPDRGVFNVHTKFRAEATYANGVRMTMETGDPAGVRFEGERGWIFVQRGEIKASDPEILRWKPGQGEVKLYQSGNHMKDFLSSMRSRKDPAAPVELGHRSNSICVMAHIAMKLGRKLAWDPAAEKFAGDDEANGLLDYPHRKPWAA
jgi:predicted dehydrogenase